MKPVVIMRGTLGWGNRRSGLEAYGPSGRWHNRQGIPRPTDEQIGDLLGDALAGAGAAEGAHLLVVAVNRRGGPGGAAAMDRIAAAIQAAAEQAASDAVLAERY